MSTRGQGRRYARNDRRSRGVLGLSVAPVENLEQARGPVLSVDQGGQEEVAIRLGLNRVNKRRRGQPNPPIINREQSVNLEGTSSSMRERARYILEYLKSKFLNLATRIMQLQSLQRERAQYIAPPPPSPQEPTSNEIAIGLSRNQVNKRKRGGTNPPSHDCELNLNLEGTSSSMMDTEQYIAPSPPPPPKEPSFSCPVCMDPFVEEVTTKCGHIFCKACITAAIKAQHKCPTCRKKLTNKNLTRIYLPITI